MPRSTGVRLADPHATTCPGCGKPRADRDDAKRTREHGYRPLDTQLCWDVIGECNSPAPRPLAAPCGDSGATSSPEADR